ncbi:DNA polymerase ligase N-terminal domain-containing protein [Phycicoccus sp.]|uniref:DNA polymerase ligase N-terminal domain-containing protein n=1 Tax=Phycicoccus sp. TaxID=1902410 RepID=UPI002BDEDC8D|nr:DNA polymerase ligase N-terminal domain-containing protein [Phycicoccus sp.]HMM96418.1 DNA polymerase ligase N-terminal domain-containing protein [Phycicoccus sp.]
MSGRRRSDETLGEYRDKRDFRRTGEPSGSRGRRRKEPVFVVQRHDASSLHFDVRIQVGDVLVSWAVPKGPSLDPRDKRLAHRTEDHPLDYADFEGVIGKGQYGAGSVVVWDTGPFENVTERDGAPVELADAVERGHVKVVLHGRKLTGAFAFTHTKVGGDEANWLLVKVDDEGADRRRKPATTQPESVLTGRTNEEVAAEDRHEERS